MLKLSLQITNDLKEAMKTKNQTKLNTLRMLQAAIKNRQIELKKPISCADITELVAKEIKQRKDSIIQYNQGNRTDLAQKEAQEIKVLEKYLPKQMEVKELSDIIAKAIKVTQAKDPTDIGKVMGEIMPRVKGKADGSLVSDLVKESLNNL